MTEVSDTLRAARKLIEKPENWCKGAYARNSSGEATSSGSDDATCWCISGALKRVAGCNGYLDCVREAVLAALGDGKTETHKVPNFNDHPDTTHPMVLDLFDRAIAMEEADG
jgi:hypothetical protein